MIILNHPIKKIVLFLSTHVNRKASATRKLSKLKRFADETYLHMFYIYLNTQNVLMSEGSSTLTKFDEALQSNGLRSLFSFSPLKTDVRCVVFRTGLNVFNWFIT